MEGAAEEALKPQLTRCEGTSVGGGSVPRSLWLRLRRVSASNAKVITSSELFEPFELLESSPAFRPSAGVAREDLCKRGLNQSI